MIHPRTSLDPEWGLPAAPERFVDAWHALTREAVLADRSARLRLSLTGDKAAEALTGLVTNDVLALQPGYGQFAVALTPKGKVLADLRILRRADDLLVDCSTAAAEGLLAMLRKYMNPRLARVADLSSTLSSLAVYGPRAAHMVSHILAVPTSEIETLPAWAHRDESLDGTPVTVVRVPDLGVTGLELFVSAEAADRLQDALLAAGVLPGTAQALEAARILAGWPRFGLDMDDTTLTQEARLDQLGAVSYTKGCYTGQEVVARLHFRGHVNRQLRGLSAEGPLLSGAKLETTDGREVGEVRSAAMIPTLGTVALAMVRREVELGSTVIARWDGRATGAKVSDLPFPAS